MPTMTFATSDDVEIPEVESVAQRGRFFKDENGRECIEISFVGQKDTIIHFTTPAHMARYKREWDAYCDKEPLALRAGTPLSALFDEKTEGSYVAANIHTLEELAALDDLQCQGVGRGTLTNRQAAREKIIQIQFDADQARRKTIDSLPTTALSSATPGEPSPDISELKKAVSGIQESMQTLQRAMLLLVERRQDEPAPSSRPRHRRRGWPKGKKRKAAAPSEPPTEEP